MVWFAKAPEPALPDVDPAPLDAQAPAEPPLAEVQPEALADGEAAAEQVPAEDADAPPTPATAEPFGEEQTTPAPRDLDAGQAPSIVPPLDPERLPASDQTDQADIESITVRRARLRAKRQHARRSLPMLQATILALVAVVAVVMIWRDSIVRVLPQTASFYSALGLNVNLRGLVFEEVKTTRETQDGVSVMLVEGTILSVARGPIDVPRLRFSVLGAKGEEIYNWTAQPGKSVLGPGERLAFRSRLAAPPAEARGVLVRFFNRNDAAGGLR
jgi:hypothetical protein